MTKWYKMLFVVETHMWFYQTGLCSLRIENKIFEEKEGVTINIFFFIPYGILFYFCSRNPTVTWKLIVA